MYDWMHSHFRVLLLLAALPLLAADESQLAQSLRAQSDFDRVQLSAIPKLPDTQVCVQSEAALASVASATELPLVYYRKGYCELTGATLNHWSQAYAQAAADFDKAIQAWPARAAAAPKRAPVEPVSSGLQALSSVAKLHADPDEAAIDKARQQLSTAVENSVCPSSVMSVDFCRAVLSTARQWLGWIAIRKGEWDVAERDFAAQPDSPWAFWVAGHQAFAQGRYPEAASRYGKAMEIWNDLRELPAPSFTQRLRPQPDTGPFLADLGGAQLLADDTVAAMKTLDTAIKTDPNDARAIFLRARTEEVSGRPEQAESDLSLASRTAFAGAKDLQSGEAHLYRGILLYRRHDFPRAEAEFASALNFDIPVTLRPDAEAWRNLAAVAGGSCGSSRERLEQSLASASPFFPKQEAQKLVVSCSLTSGVGDATKVAGSSGAAGASLK
ncbi:MAG TPA: hypothetical protein VG675_13030 [Bryobacteraceae bacterium]|nr:hypothetical protein [Bryobacteraceae bacterium]